MGSIHYNELTMVQARALAHEPRAVVLLLPVGAVEPHGPHAPLGTDDFIASGICDRAARALEDDPDIRALVLPAIAYGVTRYAAAFAGVLGVEAETLRALLLDIRRSALENGLRRIVVVNHHFEPEHVAVLRRAVDELGAGATLFDLTRRRLAERLTDEFRSGSCHAGRYETSLVLDERPGTVDRDKAARLPAIEVNMPARIAAGDTDFVALGMTEAYCGAPAEASAEEGAAIYQTLVELLVEHVRGTLRDE